MFQRAHVRDRNVAPARRPQTVELLPAIGVGKRTQTEESLRGVEACPYTAAVESAKREIYAIRSVALPALIKALRTKDMAPLAKQIAVTNAAIQVRHMLMTANQHVVALEKDSWFDNAVIQLLRREINTLTARAMHVGAYRGFEHLRPLAYQEPVSASEPVSKRTSTRTAHKLAPVKAATPSGAPASITRPKAAQPQTTRDALKGRSNVAA